MPYATCITTNIFTEMFCLIHSTTYIVYCAIFNEVFATLLSNYFSLKSVGLLHPKGSRCATVFQPMDIYIVQRAKPLVYKDSVSKV